MKCDENKPICSKCLAGGYKCDGYLELPVKRDRTTHYTNIAPCPQRRPSFRPRTSLAILAGPSVSLAFQDETESQYFSQFRELLVPKLTAGCLDTIWSETVLRICLETQFVRGAAVALSAIASSSVQFLSRENTPLVPELHHEYGLRQYGKAIKALRNSITQGNCSKRQAIVSCLIMFAIELFCGDPYAALKHAHTGSKLIALERWAGHSFMPRSQTRDMFSDTEREIILASASLRCQTISVIWLESLHVLVAARSVLKRQAGRLPPSLDDTDVAFKHFFSVMGNTSYYIQECIARVRLSKGTFDDFSRVAEGQAGVFEPILAYDVSLHQDSLPESLRQEYFQYLNDDLCFQSAIETHFSTKYNIDHSGKDRRPLLMLYHIIRIRLTLQCLITRSEYALDAYLPDFKEIVNLAQRMIAQKCRLDQHQPQRSSGDHSPLFQTENGVLYGLFIVTVMCRDSETRARALDLLSLPQQEGVLHSAFLKRIGEWIRDVEEEKQPTSNDIAKGCGQVTGNTELQEQQQQDLSFEAVPEQAQGYWSAEMRKQSVAIDRVVCEGDRWSCNDNEYGSSIVNGNNTLGGSGSNPGLVGISFDAFGDLLVEEDNGLSSDGPCSSSCQPAYPPTAFSSTSESSHAALATNETTRSANATKESERDHCGTRVKFVSIKISYKQRSIKIEYVKSLSKPRIAGKRKGQEGTLDQTVQRHGIDAQWEEWTEEYSNVMTTTLRFEI